MMGKRGPAPKSGIKRTKSGRISRSKTTMETLNEMNREKEREVISLVVNQPHRQGSESKLRECAVGRFCERHGLDAAIYVGAMAYNDIRRRWRAAKGAPTDLRLSLPSTGGDGPSAITVDGWAKRLASVRHAVIEQADGVSWLSAEILIVDDLDIPESYHEGAKKALEVLAVEMGAMRREKRAFA